MVPDFDDPRYRSYVMGRRAASAFMSWLIEHPDRDRRIDRNAEALIEKWCRTRAAQSRDEKHELDADAMIEGARIYLADSPQRFTTG